MFDIRDTGLLADLLGRPVRDVLTAKDRRSFEGRTVLITGAGGTVGSELARQIAACAPASLVLVDHSEHALFQVEQELAWLSPAARVEAVLADVTRPRDVAAIFDRVKPDVVYHAAAYKHVTMMERDVVSAVRANVFGTLYVARAARDRGARLVIVSSDKAANPRSVMGATKRVAELVALAESTSRWAPAVVRFGNILGSSGSVLTILADRLRRGLPLQVTATDATRYFMTPAEAVSLVIKADLLGRRGEIVWLDMGTPVTMGDMVERLLCAADRAGVARVPIEVIGLRPGEKLSEELTVQGLTLVPTPHADIWVARQTPFDRDALRRSVHALRRAVARRDASTALDILCGAGADYVASEFARTAASPAPAAGTRPATARTPSPTRAA